MRDNKIYTCREEDDPESEQMDCTAPTAQDAAILFCTNRDENGEYSIVQRGYATIIVYEKDADDAERQTMNVQAEAIPHYYIS